MSRWRPAAGLLTSTIFFVLLWSGRARGGVLGLLPGSTGCSGASCGTFGAPFAEPTIAGQATSAKCITGPDGQLVCKPAAGTMAMLDDGRILYWDALEGTERVQFSVILEFGNEAANDQSRL